MDEMKKNLVDAPLAGMLIVFEGEEYEILMVAYDQIFAVRNNPYKSGKVIDICDYIKDNEIRMKEERMENELQAIIDGDLLYN